VGCWKAPTGESSSASGSAARRWSIPDPRAPGAAKTELAKDAQIPFGPPKSGEFSIGHAVASREDVDALLATAAAAGATMAGTAHKRPWGIYSGYFRDPDGHLWEIMWNPQLEGS